MLLWDGHYIDSYYDKFTRSGQAFQSHYVNFENMCPLVVHKSLAEQHLTRDKWEFLETKWMTEGGADESLLHCLNKTEFNRWECRRYVRVAQQAPAFSGVFALRGRLTPASLNTIRHLLVYIVH